MALDKLTYLNRDFERDAPGEGREGGRVPSPPNTTYVRSQREAERARERDEQQLLLLNLLQSGGSDNSTISAAWLGKQYDLGLTQMDRTSFA